MVGNDYWFTDLNIKAFTEKAEKPEPVPPTPTPVDPTPVDPTPIEPTPVDPIPTPALTVVPTPAPVSGGGSGGGGWSVLNPTVVSNTTPSATPSTTGQKTDINKITNDKLVKLRTMAYVSGSSVSENGERNFEPNSNLTCSHVKTMLSNAIGSEIFKPDLFKDFDSDSKFTREASVRVLHNVVKTLWESGMNYVVDNKKYEFNDVTSEQLKSELDYLASRGIVNGYGDGNFCPDNYVTRAEFVKMLAKVLKRSSTWHGAITFVDVPKDFWAYTYIMNAANGE